MKKLVGILLFLLLYLLAFPAGALSGARAGLLLWYRSVLPVLFPFMLLSGILMRLDLLERLLPVVSRPFRAVFSCSEYGAFAILSGFLCGFPMGAKVTRDLESQGKISREEAFFLCGFVNNLSPSFILSFIAADQLQRPSLGLPLLFCILGPALLYGAAGSRRLRRAALFPGRQSGEDFHAQKKEERFRRASLDLQGTFAVIDSCIYDAVRNTVRLGAYIVMFSILGNAVLALLPGKNPLALALTACIEVSSGIHLAASARLPLCAKYILVSALGSFGGLSALAQTASIASMDRPLLTHYIKSRVAITLLSVLFSVGSVLLGSLFRLLL